MLEPGRLQALSLTCFEDLGRFGPEISKGSRPDSCCVDFGRETPKFRFEFFRDSETTIQIKFAFSRGGGLGGREENCPKTRVFFLGKRHNKILKV